MAIVDSGPIEMVRVKTPDGQTWGEIEAEPAGRRGTINIGPSNFVAAAAQHNNDVTRGGVPASIQRIVTMLRNREGPTTYEEARVLREYANTALDDLVQAVKRGHLAFNSARYVVALIEYHRIDIQKWWMNLDSQTFGMFAYGPFYIDPETERRKRDEITMREYDQVMDEAMRIAQTPLAFGGGINKAREHLGMLPLPKEEKTPGQTIATAAVQALVRNHDKALDRVRELEHKLAEAKSKASVLAKGAPTLQFYMDEHARLTRVVEDQAKRLDELTRFKRMADEMLVLYAPNGEELKRVGNENLRLSRENRDLSSRAQDAEEKLKDRTWLGRLILGGR